MTTVHGRLLDDQTRCVHWGGPTDVIAIKFRCCGRYYPCYACHSEQEDHAAQRWAGTQLDERAVLCGVCRAELPIAAYLDCDYVCPACGADFNPGCALHHHLYFDLDGDPPAAAG